MKYDIVISRSAGKEIKKLPKQEIRKITEKIDLLAEDPRPSGCKKLSGYANFYRVRLGNYRIIYSIFDQKLIVEIIEGGHRKNLY